MELARAAIDRAEFSRAVALTSDTIRAFEQREPERVWPLRVLRVQARLGLGDGTAVKELYDEPPAKYRHSADAVRRLTYLGFVEQRSERIDEAEEIAKQYQPRLLGEVYRGRALVSGKEADARKAIAFARQSKERDTEAMAFATLAKILAGNPRRVDEAVQAGERALTLTRLPNVVQNAQGTLGWAYFDLGDYDMAEELLTKAEAAAKKFGNTMNRAAWLILLGEIRSWKRDYPAADRYNSEAYVVATTAKDRGYALANRARIALALGQFDQARQFNQRALAAKREAKDKEAQLSSDIVEARILAAKDGKYPAAEKLLLAVLRDTTLHRLDAQTQLAKLYVRMKRKDNAEAAFRQAVKEAHRARGTIESELRLAFFNTTEEMLDAYVDFLVDEKRSDEALAVVEANRAESLEEGRSETPDRVDSQEVAKKTGATILSYWLGRDRSYLWVITAAGTKLYPLPADTLIERDVVAYQRALLAPGPSPMALGQSLYERLVAPAKIARGSRVIVLADGQLHTFNFETLVAPNPQHYWIEDVILVSAPSLQLLARRPRTRPSRPSLLLVGDTPSPDPLSYPPLQHAAAEMRAVKRRFVNPVVLEGAKATPSAYHNASPGKFDYLHFVAHGVSTPQRPLDSFVMLAPDGQSYKLTAREVENEKLSARLVTISSCEGAGKRTYAGEGIVGLAWAFQHAGAEQVIAALWNVNDTATATIMADMYTRIHAGDDPAVALRAAKLKWMKLGPVQAKPIHWAPFVLYSGT